MDVLLWTLIGVFFLLAYVGILVPLIPDIPFMLGGFLLYQFFLSKEGLGTMFWMTVIVFAVLLLVIEYIATGLAVKRSGGSNISVFVGMAGLLLFPFIMGPLGVIVGPFLAVFVFEWIKRGILSKALKIATGTFVGLLGSMLVKFFAITSILIWFFYII